MFRRTFGAVLLLTCVAALATSPANSAAGDFSGTYKGHQIVITITGKSPQYTGMIETGGKSYPLAGVAADQKLSGTFKAEGGEFKFVATLDGTVLRFDTDGTTYLCERQGTGGTTAAQNPLARGGEGKRATNEPSGEAARPSPARTPAGAPAGPTMRFTRLSVKDPKMGDIEAVSFLIPVGWKSEGGVQWFPDYSIQANLLMKVSDPKTGAAIEFLPLQNFTWLTQMVVPMQPGTNYLGNILWPPISDPPQFIQNFYSPTALPHLRNARMVANEDLPKIAAQVVLINGGQPSAKSGRVRYEYQVGSQPWEEDVYVTLVYWPTQMGAIWSVSSAYSFRAPKGMLAHLTPVLNTTINSLRLSPDWYGGYMYVQKLFQDRMKQGIRNARILSDTITRNSEEIRQMFSDSYRQRCESQDRIAQKFSEYIRGVETYHNPYEDRPIQLPSGYNDVWVNRSGEYILSNQAGFDPNVGSNLEWRRMPKSP
jgi:hypothetical protein